MKFLGFLIFYIVLNLVSLNTASAQNNCLLLEGLNLGCVSSVDHSCFRNKMVDNPKASCQYVGDPATSWRVEGPIAFHCKSSTNTTVCPPKQCNPDGCVTPPCVTTSECTEYQPPLCQETCVGCFNQVVTVKAGIEKGCIVCTRPYCADEPPASVLCPATYNGLVHSPADKCAADSRCPTTATDPLGKVHPVTISRNTCPTPTMPNPVVNPPPKDCPWKVDKRTATGCEAIEPDNQNP